MQRKCCKNLHVKWSKKRVRKSKKQNHWAHLHLFHPDESAANVHGMLRHDDGISFSSLAAEFRSLRASVLRLWLPEIPVVTKQVLLDIVRFNEAIDEALADSISTYESR